MYRNVDIEYIHGRTATLTIFEDGLEVEKIILSDYKTRDEMHELLRSKGFIKKSPEEIAEVVERKRLEEETDAARAREMSAMKREEAAARRKKFEEEGNLKRNEKEEQIRRLKEDEHDSIHSEF